MQNQEAFKELEMFVVQNSEGKFFRRKGYNGHGDSWVDSLKTARIYTKIGQARSVVSFFASHYPAYGIPNLVRVKAGDVEIVDETKRVEKMLERKLKAQQQSLLYAKKWELKRAEEQYEAAKAALEKLKNKK